MPHGEEFSNTLQVAVDGTPLPADVVPLLAGGYVDDSTNVPDMFVLRFNDTGGTVLTKGGFTIGAKVRLSLQSTAPGGSTPLLDGEVTAIEVEVGELGVQTLVRGLDVSHRLFRGTRVEAYVNMTASDIVQKVAQRASLTAEVESTQATYHHVTQDGVNDWDFLRRLALENDRLLTLSDGKLHFTRRTPASEAPGGTGDSRTDPLVLEAGVSLVHLRGTITAAGQVPSVEVRGWDPATKKEVVTSTSAATTSAVPDSGATPAALASTFSSPPYVLGLAGLHDQAAVSSIAGSLADHLAGGFAELEGTARGNPGLRAGTAVRVAGVGEQFNGKYVLTSTRHEFSPDHGYRTTFGASNTSERSLYGATNAAVRDRPTTPGVVPALVTSVQDPDKLGRVKIRLPWLSDQYESWWARTLQPGAGKDRGAAVLPEVGDEVLVAFSQGDLQHPFVLGGLYNGQDKPGGGWEANVDSTSGEVVRRGFVSRTGMVVELTEKPGAEQVVLSSNGGAQKIVLTQTADKGIEIVSEGPLSVTAKSNVDLSTGTGDVSVKGTNLKIEASGSLELKGTTVKLSATGTAELSATGVTTVKGSIVKIN
ncbi:VgrG-related protein [Nocardioides sp. C4-1]|uniref:VgrG-related protein n=1 Tax=Nocardioides sp. C4-1 TaxID=3151851 RepID=UPI003262FCD0